MISCIQGVVVLFIGVVQTPLFETVMFINSSTSYGCLCYFGALLKVDIEDFLPQY